MENKGGFVKFYRKMTDWEWYDDLPTRVLFMHLLVTVNWKDGKWHGIEIKRGQRITSLSVLAEESGLSVQQVRTALKHLKSTNEITIEVTSRYRLITVENYSKYQDVPSEDNRPANKPANKPPTSNQQTANKPPTSNQQTANKPPTTIEEYKNKEEVKNFKNKRKENLTVSSDKSSETVCATERSAPVTPGDIDNIVNHWNQLPSPVAHVEKVTSTSKRAKMLKCRIREYGADSILTAIENIENSRFLCGDNHNGWVITFDWFVRPNNFPKVLDGNYNDVRGHPQESTHTGRLDWMRDAFNEEVKT